MEAQYLNHERPHYDSVVTDLCEQNADEDAGGNTMAVGILGESKEVYRVVSLTGLAVYLNTGTALEDAGFTNVGESQRFDDIFEFTGEKE